MNIINQIKNFDTTWEFYQLLNYFPNRFKSLKELELTSSCLPFIQIAVIICALTPKIFSVPIVITLDYLNYSYTKEEFAFQLGSPFSELYFALKKDLKGYEKKTSESPAFGIMSQEIKDILISSFNQKVQDVEKNEKSTLPNLLIIKTKHDPSQSFLQGTTIKDDVSFQKLLKKYKITLIDNISNIEQLNEEMKKTANVVQQVWIFAHGNCDCMQLDETNFINANNIQQLKDTFESKLSKNADVILFSCETGAKKMFSDNIAQKFSKMLPGRTIWAPKISVARAILDIKENEFSIRFWANCSRFEVLIDKIWTIFRLKYLSIIGIDWNLTSKYKTLE